MTEKISRITDAAVMIDIMLRYIEDNKGVRYNDIVSHFKDQYLLKQTEIDLFLATLEAGRVIEIVYRVVHQTPPKQETGVVK